MRMKSGTGIKAELIAGGSEPAAILTIEVAILIPSYRNYEEDLLRQRAEVATQAITMFLNSKSGQAVTPDRLEVLLANSSLTGISMIAGGTRIEAGEPVTHPQPANGDLRGAVRPAEGVIDLSWSASLGLSDYKVLARADVSDVSGNPGALSRFRSDLGGG